MASLLFVILLLIFGDCWAIEDSEPNYSATDIKSVQIEALKHTVDQLIIRDKMKETQLSEMMESISSLKGENLELKSRVKNLEIMNSKLAREKCSELLTDIEKDSTKRKQDAIMNKTKNDDNWRNNTGVSTEDAPVKNSNRRFIDSRMIERDTTENVAFTAMYGNAQRTLSKGQTIVFEAVKTNIGGQYNKYTGIFFVNTAGTYVLFVNTICQPGQSIHAEIVKDGVNLSYLYCFDEDTYANGSNMVIAELSIGSAIWVRSYHVYNNDKPALSVESSFSGFLLN